MTARNEAYDSGQYDPLTEIAIIVVVSAVAFVAESAAADFLRWGEEARRLVAVLVGAVTAVWLTLRHGGTMADLGLKRPDRWWTAPFWALGIMIVFIVAQGLVPQLLSPFFNLPEPDMSRYDSIRSNLTAAIAMAMILPLTAAIPEEIVYRGFLIGRLTRLFGNGRGAALLAVGVQALIFGGVHFQWGLGGIIATSTMGTVWGIAYLLCGRNLWIVIIAHSTAHVLLVTQIYFSPPS